MSNKFLIPREAIREDGRKVVSFKYVRPINFYLIYAWVPLTLTCTRLHFSLVAHYVGLELLVLDHARVVRVHDLKEGVDEFSFDRDTELGNEIRHFINGQ